MRGFLTTRTEEVRQRMFAFRFCVCGHAIAAGSLLLLTCFAGSLCLEAQGTQNHSRAGQMPQAQGRQSGPSSMPTQGGWQGRQQQPIPYGSQWSRQQGNAGASIAGERPQYGSPQQVGGRQFGARQYDGQQPIGGVQQQQGRQPQGTPQQQNGSTQGQRNPVQRLWRSQPPTAGPSATRGEHLPQWIQQHNQLNNDQQQRALQHEPGFQQLPRETQQRMMDRLQHLNTLPPQQRERVLQRSEALERLTPDQRGQVRSAMGQLGALPQDRRRMVAKSFRDLRNLPPQERNQILNSPEYHQQFSDEERGTLGNLLSVSPIIPAR